MDLDTGMDMNDMDMNLNLENQNQQQNQNYYYQNQNFYDQNQNYYEQNENYFNQNQNYYEQNNNPNINNNNINSNNDINNNINEQNPQNPNIDDLICDQKAHNTFIDDDFLLQLHQRLAQTREQRKISENSVKALNNRVHCLKEENQKTLSKINLTRQKTNDKLLNMERKKSQSKEKIDRAKRLENDLVKLKEKNYNKKVERDNGLINSRKKVLSENKLKGKI